MIYTYVFHSLHFWLIEILHIPYGNVLYRRFPLHCVMSCVSRDKKQEWNRYTEKITLINSIITFCNSFTGRWFSKRLKYNCVKDYREDNPILVKNMSRYILVFFKWRQKYILNLWCGRFIYILRKLNLKNKRWRFNEIILIVISYVYYSIRREREREREISKNLEEY